MQAMAWNTQGLPDTLICPSIAGVQTGGSLVGSYRNFSLPLCHEPPSQIT